MSQDNTQFSLFSEPTTDTVRHPPPCVDEYRCDVDGYIVGRLPPFARQLPREDPRVNSGPSSLANKLCAASYRQLCMLERLGCLKWGSYNRIDDGPWFRIPKGVPCPRAKRSGAGFSVYRTDATARLPRACR